MANRILDIPDVGEDVIVSRLLITVHKALDDAYPSTSGGAGRQFSRTLFADTAADRTAVTALPTPEEIAAAEQRANERAAMAPQQQPSATSNNAASSIILRAALALVGAGAIAYWILSGRF